MAEQRSEERARRSGWSATVALGVVGIASGFAVGIVAGVSWEEPLLVFDYLTGDTEQIDWTSTDSALGGEEVVADRTPIPSLPAVAASPPSAPRESRDAAEAVKTPRPAPNPASAVQKPLPEGGYSIQVGAFSESNAAHSLADSLREKGYRVYVSRGEGAAAAWRVRVGPLRTRADAENTALKLERREKLPTWVLSESS